jgi:UDP-GlcNAc:undecaprenyl-phosphate GlcNAc-1-phosphate transferase
MFDTYTLILIVATYIISMLVYRLLLRQSKRYTLRKANVSAVRFSSQTKPVSGGIGFFIMSIMAAVFFLYYADEKTLITPQILTIGLALTIAFFAGLLDDINNTPPLLKFISQLIIAVICIYSGITIDISGSLWFNYCFTALWIIGVMNSVNMLDNMDAVASVAALTILISITANNFFGNRSLAEEHFLMIIFFTILAFLFFNWHPSKMYMGDSGSQFLGALLAIFAIKYIWNINLTIPSDNSILRTLSVIFLAFLIPISDTFAVTVNRLLRGKSPFVGGRDHTTHHFFYRGLSEKSIATMFFIISVITNLTVIMISTDTISILHPVSLIVLLFAFAYFIFAYINTRISKPKEDEKNSV